MVKESVLDSLKKLLMKNGLKLSSGESCTGGLISSYLTDIDGSSNFIEQNFVTYAPCAKEEILGVDKNTIEKYGVVSTQVAKEMAEGLLKYSDCGVSTTGYSGPTGGDEKNPIGTVYIGLSLKKENNGKCQNIVKTVKYNSKFKDRCRVKEDFTQKALEELLNFLTNEI